MNGLPATRTFLAGIALASVAALPFVLDLTLVPRFVALSLCLTLTFWFLYKNTKSLNILTDLTVTAYAAYTLFCCLSIFWANTRSEAIFDSAKQLMAFFVFLLTCFFLEQREDPFLKHILKLSVLLLPLILLFVAIQFFSIPEFNKETLYQITGINGHKNLLSSFLYLDLFFLLLASSKLTGKWNVTSLAAIILNLALILFLRTKAVWLGLAAALLLYGVFQLVRLRTAGKTIRLPIFIPLAALLILLNLGFFLFLQPLIQKSIGYTSQMDTGGKIEAGLKLEEERLILWDKTFHMIGKKPLAGMGMGNWQIEFPDATLNGLWRSEDLNYTYQRPHNDLLWILAETGFTGFNLFLLFLCSCALVALRAGIGLPKGTTEANILLLSVAFICGYFTIAFFDFPKERIEHLVWSNILLAIASYYSRKHQGPALLRTFQLKKNALLLLLLIVMLPLALTGLLRLSGEYHLRKMYNYKNSGDLANVIKSGNAAVSFAYSIDPTSVPVHWYTGNAQALLGNHDAAHKDFLKALSFNPYNRNVLNDLGSSYVYANDVLKAKMYYEEAARISPRFDDPKLNLAAMYIQAKDFDTADRWLKSILHDSERRKNYQQIVDAMRQNQK